MAEDPKPQQPPTVAHSKKKSRSPTYPIVDLERAIKRAKELHDKEGRHAARFDVVATHWGYKPKSSGAMQTVATLRQFGLVSFEGGKRESRMVKLTDLAIRVILDQREDERRLAIQDAALRPKLYASLWRLYGSELPSDSNIISHLTVDLGFNPSIAGGVLKGYRDTLAYAKPDPGATVSESAEDQDEFEEDDEAELEAATAPLKAQARADQRPPPPPGTSREAEVLRTNLAGGRTVRVLFSGPPPTQAEIAKLIAHLELSKDDYPESLSPEPSAGEPAAS